MSVLSIQAVTKRFGERVIFSDASLRLAHGERAGLVGPNGAGKTTLLRIAAGLEPADSGAIAVARGARIGFLEQELLTEIPGTVAEHARGAAAHLRELEAEMRDLEPRLGSGDPTEMDRYADVQQHFEHAGGYDFDATVGRVLGGLGLGALADREVATLSGGERTRLGLARLLLDDPDVLLLDEPTNHLDLAGLDWLERFLVERRQTLLVSSHDRWFLDRVTSRTYSFERGTVAEYRGGYTHYARQRADNEEARGSAAKRQAAHIAHEESFIARYGAGQRSKEARGRGKKLARLERVAGPESVVRHGWRLEAAHLAGDVVVTTTPLAVGHGERVVLRTPSLRIERGARVMVAGPNGAGKTTLVRTIVGDLPVLSGYVSAAPTARVAFLAQAQAELMDDTTVLDSLRNVLDEQSARDLLARFLFRGDDVFASVSTLSGGERSRLALARLSAREANFLVLDEPTNHLDLAAREALERVLAEYQGTVLAVSHDRYFIDKLASHVWLVGDGRIRVYEGNWSALQRGDAREIPGEGAVPHGAAGEGYRQPARPHGVKPGTEAGGGPRDPRAREAPRPRRSSPAAPRDTAASRPRRRPDAAVAGLEARIAAMEQQLKALEARVAEIAQSGNYMETRRVGEEHESLARELRALYSEWTAKSEDT